MKDMFYNYEHHIAYKEYPIAPEGNKKDKLDDYTCVSKLLNAKGEEIGLKAKQNSIFYVYFNFFPQACVDIHHTLSSDNLHLDIVDFKREVVASFPVELSDYTDTARAKIITSENGPLKYGVYRMRLYTKIDDIEYNLFSEESGILSIE